MGQIIAEIDLQQVIQQLQDRTTVLAGGCFDILHVGHIRFLSSSKSQGDILIVLLESDEVARKLKGKNRPYFLQQERAEVLSEMRSVDYVILLPKDMSDSGYESITKVIRPSVIAYTQNDPKKIVKECHAKLVQARLYEVPYVKTFSSSEIARIVGME